MPTGDPDIVACVHCCATFAFGESGRRAWRLDVLRENCHRGQRNPLLHRSCRRWSPRTMIGTICSSPQPVCFLVHGSIAPPSIISSRQHGTPAGARSISSPPQLQLAAMVRTCFRHRHVCMRRHIDRSVLQRRSTVAVEHRCTAGVSWSNCLLIRPDPAALFICSGSIPIQTPGTRLMLASGQRNLTQRPRVSITCQQQMLLPPGLPSRRWTRNDY